MPSPATLKKHKLDSESLKALFTAKKPSDKIKKLTEMLCARIDAGRDQKLRDYRIWAAVDIAYDAPFYQETPTLLRHILSTCTTTEDVMKAANQWGINQASLICKTCDDKGAPKYELNAPVFYEVLLPFVRAYVSIRLAKLFNDRNGIPLFKFEPQKNTELNRVRCEIITDIVQAMSTQFGYSATLRQMIFNTLLYSVSILFPMEPWYEEKQEDENGKEVVTKQGIRYAAPHITQTGWDLQYPLSTLNTDTGCTFAFYWTIGRFGELSDETRYWNTDKIAFSKTDWFAKDSAWYTYFQSAFPCVQKYPPSPAKADTSREKEATYYSSSSDYDTAIFITHMFCKLVPKDWGLGDYKYPVWFKFTLASDDTVVYADSYPYVPPIVSQYDADQNRVRNASLALEIIPSQDLLGNLLNQVLLTNKRNLSNIIFYDVQQIGPTVLESLKTRSHWQYKEINLIPYDPYKDRLAQVSGKGECFKPVTFPYANSNEMLQSLSIVINMLERLIGMSPQEIGSAASHQQSKAEIQVIQSNTTNRVTYSGAFIDEARDAQKRQLYSAAMYYLPSDVVGQVSTGIPNLEKHLEELGFKTGAKSDGEKTVEVKGDKAKLRLEGFASTRDLPDRGQDTQAATAMMTAITSINNNPNLASIIDKQSMIDLIEIAAKKMGADDDFNVRIDKAAVAAQADAQKAQGLQQVVPQIAEAIKKDIDEQIAQPLIAALQKEQQMNGEQDAQIKQVVELIAKLTEKVTQMQQIAAQAPPLAPPVPLVPPIEPQPPLTDVAPNGIPAGNPGEVPIGMA